MNTLPLSPMCVGPRGRGAFSAFSTAYAKMTGGCFTNPRGLAGATSTAPPPVPQLMAAPDGPRSISEKSRPKSRQRIEIIQWPRRPHGPKPIERGGG